MHAKFLAKYLKEKELLEHIHRRKGSIEINVKGIWWKGVDLIYLALSRDLAVCYLHGNKLSGLKKCRVFLN